MEVTRYRIEGVPRLDPVTVYVENHEPGRGVMTFTCWGSCFTNGWGSMGDGYTIESFFLKANDDYLANKFWDYDALGGTREIDLDKIESDWRDQFGDDEQHLIDDIDFSTQDTIRSSEFLEMAQRLYGSEWWEELPKCNKPHYNYLLEMLGAIRSYWEQNYQPA